MRVLTWNLMHGRAVPPAGRELLDEFSAALAGWPWDVALLQEVPPWWPAILAERLQADQRSVLTSRNSLLALRRFVARRRPDVIKSNGGGSNAILVRGPAIEQHRVQRLSWLPERRWVHAIRVGALWIANLHTEGRVDQVSRASSAALAWAAGAPLVLGGDFNLRTPSLPGLEPAASSGVDHVLVRGLSVDGPGEVLDRGILSDHAPLIATLR